MSNLYTWPWVEEQAAQTTQIWQDCAGHPVPAAAYYHPKEQQKREKAYDEALRTVEREMKRAPRTRSARLATQQRVTAAFARFSALALDLSEEAIDLLTGDFLPAGTQLARWARRFDPTLSMADIVQACRNAWTACGMQPLFGEPMRLTSSILGYSLLYPYSDNFLDRETVSTQAKLNFSERFRKRLRGESLSEQDPREFAIWTMVQLIENQYPRAAYPQVYDCLLAIHRAQENSLKQLSLHTISPNQIFQDHNHAGILQISCAKGGTSVLADAILARGWLNGQESQFAFEWGVLLQLGDDLQDLAEDMQRGSNTLFTRAAQQGIPLDNLTRQLLNFSDRVAARMDHLPHASPMLRSLLRMAWRSLIVGAVAYSHQFFSHAFLKEIEPSSPFRFAFLRARRDKLINRQGLFPALFQAFLEEPESSDNELPMPEFQANKLAEDSGLAIYRS